MPAPVRSRPPKSVRFDAERPLAGRLPPLNMLRAFEAAGRTGSMRKAAHDIGISHTVVSRHIRNLEAWMGWKLLNAGPRGITLTQEGATLFSVVTNAFQSIAGTSAQLRSKAGTDALHIWCIPGLATRFLTPRLDDIRQSVSCGEVLLRAIDRMPDFSRAEADLMIGFTDFDRLPDGAIPLLQPRMFPVVSPAWLDVNGNPSSLEDLTRQPLIHEESYEQWATWFKKAGLAINHSLTGPRLWDANLGFDAALAGQGIALTSNLLAARELEDGRLVELFETDIRVGGYFLLKRPSSVADEQLQRFQSWIERLIREAE
ncbi:LysR substrate-binding domain-containing protein [Roseibium sp. MMSF_3544]|uniref:LysR substrate-binding domain-containing protein n=1 Tax=unclassified Roseibium TaxID=2629323 RepID=UPI00273E3542|nr:LysR substrate-binding domain-containing protein [Roseibium sp. MMSF_3544]